MSAEYNQEIYFLYDGYYTEILEENNYEKYKTYEKYEISFKKTGKLILLFKEKNIEDSLEEKIKVNFQIPKDIYALCKSNLQKCVRRGEKERAISTALSMLVLNPSDLLRRIPIIMVEDALIHPESFNFLVWLMCATSKGYILNKKEIERVLSIVGGMCDSKQYEKYRSDIEPKKIKYSLSKVQEDFLFSLEIRREYGGMWCDKEMLRKHQLIWRARFVENPKYWNILSEQEYSKVNIDSLKKFEMSDILPVSVDYHVFPWLLNDFPKESKLAIWLFVSGKNLKTPFSPLREVTKKIEECYSKIKKEYTRRVLTIYKKLLMNG